jgi:hypothetical protein
MTRATQKHKNYEANKAGWISIYPSIEEPNKKYVLRDVITQLKGCILKLSQPFLRKKYPEL